MTLGIDLDGVLVDFDIAFAKILNRIEPKSVDVYAKDFPNCWGWFEAYGWNADTIARAWTEAKSCGYFWKMLPPYPSFYEDIRLIDKLRNQGHEIYFITTRSGATAKLESEQWLSERGMGCPTVIMAPNKEDKGAICRVLGVDWMIDDSPDVLLKMPIAITKSAMVARPWNVGYNGYFNKTVSSVREALADVI